MTYLRAISAVHVGRLDKPRQKLCSRCGIDIDDGSRGMCRDCRDAEKPISYRVLAKLRQEEIDHPEEVAAFNAGLLIPARRA